MPRFVLLEHSGAPDDPAGVHWDLLLEAGDACRTWRLSAIPRAGGPTVNAEPIAPHRLAWLDREAGEVSGGRGFARRVDAGAFTLIDGSLAGDGPAGPLAVRLAGAALAGTLVIESGGAACVARFVAGAMLPNR